MSGIYRSISTLRPRFFPQRQRSPLPEKSQKSILTDPSLRKERRRFNLGAWCLLLLVFLLSVVTYHARMDFGEISAMTRIGNNTNAAKALSEDLSIASSVASVHDGGQNNLEALVIETSTSKPTILLGIFSVLVSSKVDRRNLIRSTYLSHPQLCPLNMYQSTTTTARDPNCRILYTFVVGGNPNGPWGSTSTTNLTLNPTLFAEQQDVTYLNIRDNMNSGKTPTWFAYAATVAQGLGVPYIAKVDDDTIVHVHSLLKYMDQQLPKRPQRVYFGYGPYDCRRTNSTICRGLTPYNWATGEFYVLSWDLALYVTSLEDCIKNQLEDVHMARLVHSHPEPIDRHMLDLKTKREFWEHPFKDAKSFEARWNDVKTKDLQPVSYNNSDVPSWSGRL